MDEMDFLVSETYKHFEKTSPVEHQSEEPRGMKEEEDNYLPCEPGLLYHLQKSSSVFVLRTFVSQNIKEDYQLILQNPEEYPSLRLIDATPQELESKLRFFTAGTQAQAEIIHDQVCNRRFPTNEEIMCNISDPGFSWWLVKKPHGFQLAFTLSMGMEEETTKLGPLGDQQLALRTFQQLGHLMEEAGLSFNVQNEINRVQFSDGEELLMEVLKDLFEFGVMNDGLTHLFKLLAKRISDHSKLETLWFYFQELAAMRRFWIQVQYDLNSNG